jgi:hypothetical protein
VDPAMLGAIYEKKESIVEQLLQGWAKPAEDPAGRKKESKKF